MSKITHYMNGNIIGFATDDVHVRESLSEDGSVLKITPEMVAIPRSTIDIRKMLRFTWQLAEKGHVLGATARGFGGDTTGAAISSGVIISLTEHLNKALEIDTKQKLIRVQPGMRVQDIESALNLHGFSFGAIAPETSHSTIGGAISNGDPSVKKVLYQLEVVLANGDIIQTENLSRRALNSKKGLQNFEGEIYRELDALIEENRGLIEEKIAPLAEKDTSGYGTIAQLKKKDGSFNLGPLFAGAQGTLGIIDEMILSAQFLNHEARGMILVCDSYDQLVTCAPFIQKTGLACFDVYDGEAVVAALKQGKMLKWQDTLSVADLDKKVILYIEVSDFSTKKVASKTKKIATIAAKYDIPFVEYGPESIEAGRSIADVISLAQLPQGVRDASAPAILQGFHVPLSDLPEFATALHLIREKYRTTLAFHGSPMSEMWSIHPVFFLNRANDRQRMLKMIDEMANLISHHGGTLVSSQAEGRLKANFAYKYLDADVQKLYKKIRTIFDPRGTLNPGVKERGDLRVMVNSLRTK